jgi:hypothetical protein
VPLVRGPSPLPNPACILLGRVHCSGACGASILPGLPTLEQFEEQRGFGWMKRDCDSSVGDGKQIDAQMLEAPDHQVSLTDPAHARWPSAAAALAWLATTCRRRWVPGIT